MSFPTRTPEGEPNRCPVCHQVVHIEPSITPRDAPCPHCGCLLWFQKVSEFEKLDFMVPEAFAYNLDVSSKGELVKVLVHNLVDIGHLSSSAGDDVIGAILRREELGSTGVGRGLAIPHAKHPSIQRIVATVGFVPVGVDFDSLDGQPVTTACLLLAPPDRPGDYLRALEKTSRTLRSIA